MEQLLEAAAAVFAQTGYATASTNAIAREAGVSPGTLYQFFPNKQAIAVELGHRLLGRMRLVHGEMFSAATARLPLTELIDRVIDPSVAFNLENPAFLALMQGSPVVDEVADERAELGATLQGQLENLIRERVPSLPSAECVHTAATAYAIFRALVPLVVEHEGDERAAYTQHLKAALYRYLEPVLGSLAVRTRPDEDRDAGSGEEHASARVSASARSPRSR